MKVAVIITALLVPVILLHPVFSKDRLNADALNSKGMHELSVGNNSAAAEYFRQAIAADPLKKNYYNNLAAAYIRMKDYYNAEQQLKTALAIDPYYTKALSNMSVVLFRTGRYREAYEYYKRAEKSDPAYTNDRFEKKRVLTRMKEQSRENPDDENLKRIILQLEASGE